MAIRIVNKIKINMFSTIYLTASFIDFNIMFRVLLILPKYTGILITLKVDTSNGIFPLPVINKK
jgi:hypothetical protein